MFIREYGAYFQELLKDELFEDDLFENELFKAMAGVTRIARGFGGRKRAGVSRTTFPQETERS